MTLAFLIGLFSFFPQETGEASPPPVVYDPDTVITQARARFRQGDFQAALTTLRPAVRDGYGPAMLLAADAHYAIGTEEAYRRAVNLYERCIYESDEASAIPFPDHSYFQLAGIYLAESRRAREAGDRYEARERAAEVDFYLGRLIAKYPDSFYRDRALRILFDLAVDENDYSRMKRYAESIWTTSVDPGLLDRVEPIVFLDQPPEAIALPALADVWTRHQSFIRRTPELLTGYARLFEEKGDLGLASELFLLSYNLWPGREDGASALRRLADLHRRRGEWDAAAFLYARIMEDNPGSSAEAYAWLGVAEMMERGQLADFRVRGQERSYLELAQRIVTSVLDAPIRATYAYRLATYNAAIGNPEHALLIMRNLITEYERGPFVGLYRSFYENLLFTLIERRYAAEEDWALDRLYRDHLQLLAFTTQTRYPHLVARAYVRLDLPSSALQVYEAMWSFKESLRGFDLAFEEALTDYLFLLNAMRRDETLRFRLADYRDVYVPGGRFGDAYLYLQTLLDSRTMEPEPFLTAAREQPLEIASEWDARRLRRIAVTAQEQGDWDLCDDLYARAIAWSPMERVFPDFLLEAELYQADRLYALGNYHEAERRFRAILADRRFDDRDRDWAYLQIARLHELEGEMLQSLRIYGQIAYAEDEASRAWSTYARKRMATIAREKEIEDLEKELLVGEF